MICICVACMLQQPTLFLLSAEHRKVLQTIISPDVNIAELERFKLLVCINCLHQIQLVQVFQQTALRGAKNLIMLYKRIELQNLVQNIVQWPVQTEQDPFSPSSTRKEVEFIEVPQPQIKNESPDLISEEPATQAAEIKQENSLSEELIIKNDPEPDNCDTPESDHGNTDIREFNKENIQKASTTITDTQDDVHFEVLTHRTLFENLNNKPNSDAANASPDPGPNTSIPQPLQPDPSTKNDTDNSTKKKSLHTRKVFLSASEKADVLNTYNRIHDDWPKNEYIPRGVIKKETADIHGISLTTVSRIVNSYLSPRHVSCPECDKKLSINSSLQEHILAKHTQSSPSKCEICGVVCKNDFRLFEHQRKRHTAEIVPEEKTIDNLNLELFCKECKIQYSDKTSFKSHMMTLKHVTRDQWRFECDTCHTRFLTKKRLEEHVNIQHLKKNLYKCDKCDKSYAKLGGLRSHVTVVHDKQKAKKRYVCDQCGAGFTASKNLKEHMFKHTGARPFACPLCPATFTFSSSLYTHNKLKHLKIKRKLAKKKGQGRKKKENSGADGRDEESREGDAEGTEKGDTGGTEMEDTEQTEEGETKRKKRKRTEK